MCAGALWEEEGPGATPETALQHCTLSTPATLRKVCLADHVATQHHLYPGALHGAKLIPCTFIVCVT